MGRKDKPALAASSLPLRVRASRYETAISILSRLATRNGYASIKELLGRAHVASCESDLSASAAVRLAAGLNGMDENQLYPSALLPAGMGLRIDGVFIGRVRRTFRGRVCVRCLEEDMVRQGGPVECRPYSRDWWQVPYIVGCPQHAVDLVAECPSCGRNLDPWRLKAHVCSCGLDLVRARLDLQRRDTSADAYLLGRLGRLPIQTVPLLDALQFTSAAIFMRVLGALLNGDVQQPLPYESADYAANTVALAWRAVADGQDSMDQAIAIMVSRLRNTGNLSGSLGTIQSWLTYHCAAELNQFGECFSQDAIATGNEDRWRAIWRIARGIGLPPKSVRPRQELAQMRNRDERPISAAENRSMWQGRMRPLASDSSIRLTATEACSSLGVSSHQLKDLVKANVIRPAGHFGYRVFDADDLRESAKTIYGDAVIVTEPADLADGLITIEHAVLLLKMSWAKVIAAVHHGSLRTKAIVVRQGEPPGLNKTMFSCWDVMRLAGMSPKRKQSSEIGSTPRSQ